MTLASLAAAWLAGILLGLQLQLAPLPVALLALATLPLGLTLRLMGWTLWPVLLTGCLLLGLLRTELVPSPEVPLLEQDTQWVTLRGWVKNDPEAGSRSVKFVLALEAIDRGDGWQPRSDQLQVFASPPESLVSARNSPHFRYGDGLEMSGTLIRPEPLEDFDYASYLASQGIAGVFWSRRVEWVSQGQGHRWQAWIFHPRRRLAEGMERALPVPQSAIAQALVLGLREPIPQEVEDRFRNTGTSHLLAISGLHVGLLLVLSMTFASWLLGRRRQIYLILPLLAMWLYTGLSGMPPSAVRASIMGTSYLTVLALGRPPSLLPALAGSAILMTALDPKALTQISFQLSFVAMAGILLILPHLSGISSRLFGGLQRAPKQWVRWFGGLLSWISSGIIVSSAATLSTLPLVAANFQRIPVFGIPITLLALPSLPLALGGAALAGVVSAVHPVLGQPFGWVAWFPLSYLLLLVSAAPETTVSGSWVTPVLIGTWYLVLSGLLLVAGRWRRLRRWWRERKATNPVSLSLDWAQCIPNTKTAAIFLGAVAIGATSIFCWAQILDGTNDQMHVYFFDVGQGDSMLVVTPRGRQVLIDGGPTTESATELLGDFLSFYDRSLDLVILTHLDTDHSRGLLEVLDRFNVGGVLVGVNDRESFLFPQWQGALDRSGAQAVSVVRGQRIILEEDVMLEVLHPPNQTFFGSPSAANNSSLVLRLVYGEVAFLLTGDIEAETELQLATGGQELQSQVLKVPHHGSDTSSTPEFLRAVEPQFAIISAGLDNRHGHPNPLVLTRLAEAIGAEAVYQTLQHGTVKVVTDGRTLRVIGER